MQNLKWLELIRVRSSRTSLEAAKPSLEEQLREIERSADGAETSLLKHAIYDGDLAVVLIWRNESAPQKTRVGLMVAQHLQQVGSVDHAVWVPANR